MSSSFQGYTEQDNKAHLKKPHFFPKAYFENKQPDV